MDKLKGWRTLIFAAVVALVGVLEAFDWATVIPEQYHGWALALIGVVIAWLRKVTAPVGKQSPDRNS